jgi:hypothetical protein
MAPAARRLLGIADLLPLASCATSPEPWTKPGVDAAALCRDLAYCEREATGLSWFLFNAWLGADYDTVRARLVKKRTECMEARGWRLVEPG